MQARSSVIEIGRAKQEYEKECVSEVSAENFHLINYS